MKNKFLIVKYVLYVLKTKEIDITSSLSILQKPQTANSLHNTEGHPNGELLKTADIARGEYFI